MGGHLGRPLQHAERRFAFTLRSRSVTASRPPSSGHRHVRLAALACCAIDHCHMVAILTPRSESAGKPPAASFRLPSPTPRTRCSQGAQFTGQVHVGDHGAEHDDRPAGDDDALLWMVDRLVDESPVSDAFQETVFAIRFGVRVAVDKPVRQETIQRADVSRDHGGVALIFQDPDQFGKAVIIVGVIAIHSLLCRSYTARHVPDAEYLAAGSKTVQLPAGRSSSYGAHRRRKPAYRARRVLRPE